MTDDSTHHAEHPTLSSIAEVAAALRGDLAAAEGALRNLSHDAAAVAPSLAARLNVAARLIHNAASALSSDRTI